MSAFLGPIHYWLYNKILFQEKLTESLLEQYQDVYKSLEDICGTIETKPLEDVIDTSNIHGWLQGQILIAEKRYANAVHNLMEKKSLTLENLQEQAWFFGRKHPLKGVSAPELYKELQDLLLDGMPCDHVNLLIEQEEKRVQWKRTADLHSSHWNEIGSNGKIYYLLRDSLLKGMLSSTCYEYTENDDICEIK